MAIGSRISVFTGATSLLNGTNGLVPAPLAGQQGLYLRGDATWADPSTGGVFAWTVVVASQTIVTNNGYITNGGALITLTLPAASAVGDVIRVVGKSASGWSIAQAAGQTIHFGIFDSTTGATGHIDSANRYDAVELVCTVANTDWTVLSSIGNISIT